jgi:hypothetical protein
MSAYIKAMDVLSILGGEKNLNETYDALLKHTEHLQFLIVTDSERTKSVHLIGQM